MGFFDEMRNDSPSRRRHHSSRSSYSRSGSSFFNFGGGSSRGHNRARPRSGFMARLRKFIRDIYSYMRRHPMKVFMLVIMPLITGGALTKILSQFGVRLPAGLQQFVGGGSRGYSESQRFYARGGARDFGSGSALPGMGGGIGDSINSLMGIAKMFI